MDDEDISFATTGYLTLKRRIRRKNERGTRKRRKMWVQEIYKQRNESGIYHNLVLEMALGDSELISRKYLSICVNCIFYMYGLHLSLFYSYMRLSPESFKYFLNVVGPIISKEDTRFS